MYHTMSVKKLKKKGLNKSVAYLHYFWLLVPCNFTAPSIDSLVQLKFETVYHVSYNGPNQRAPKMTTCTLCYEMECVYTVALIFVTDL